MAYRTQSTRSQYRDVSPSEEDNSYARDITAAATAFLGGELISLGKRNAERKQINNALMLQSEANRVKLMTDVGKLATLENGVDKTQLKETSSAVIKDFSDAQLRVNKSTGTYVYTDPLTGQEMTREDDLKTISQASDYINSIGSDIEANEALIGKLQEQIAMNNIGNHPGGIDMNTVDPRILSIALGDDPSKGMRFTETYKVTHDKEKGYMTNVVYKGKAIKEANKALGVSGDEFTINTKSLAGILNDPERNPANMYAYLSSNNFVGEDKMFGKQASQLTDPKTGRLRDNFYTNVDSGKAINIGGNRMQIVDRDALKYDEVHSALNGSSVGAVGTTMRGNNPQQVITDIRAYTRYNEETKEYYYHEPVVKNGNLQYNDKGEVDMQDDPTVLVKDGQLMVDQNDLDSKLTEMYTQFQLTEMGAYDKIKTTPIGNPYTKDETETGDEVDTSLFNILSTSAADKPEEFMLGGEDKVLEVKNITLNDENFTGIGRDAEGPYVVYGGDKNRDPKKYNFYKNALIESVDKNEKPSLLARFDELEEMTPSESVNIKSVVDMIVNEAKKDEYQKEEGLTGMLGAKYDDEVKFAEYLQGLGFDPKTINETDLSDVSFDDEGEMTTYIKDKIFGSDINKDVARKMSGKDVGASEDKATGGTAR